MSNKNTPEERDRIGHTMAANLQAHKGPSLFDRPQRTLGEAVADAQQMLAKSGFSAETAEQVADAGDDAFAEALAAHHGDVPIAYAEWTNSSEDEQS